MTRSTNINSRAPGGDDPTARELEALRTELDGIDDRLLEDVRARIEVCTRIAELKRRHAIPVMQPRRVGAVHEHAHRFAIDHDLSTDFLHALYDLMISETCRVEDLIVGTETSQRAGPDRDPARHPSVVASAD
ncbi:chorismate mutase family protein [Gordonia sp. SCSIO 19800]|uniref:chorismate mutase family protein n=1 Tax=Gordonia sp. SCSIO 19800 TaxID=2826926 RepID=UPI001B826E53|nr:chorismate mutase family protein [Gordonia sp. SCSIO 19800]MBR7193363.1 chorismate mutase family protein [Gordonia sp. SCSIO 19800]